MAIVGYHHCSIYIFIVYFALVLGREVPSPPLIVKQPPTDEVLFQVESSGENDKPFYIECEAIGEPAPKYRWIKNGKHFDWQAYDDRISQQPGRGTLSIAKPQDVDLGQYQCFAENEYGIATSNSVFMRKAVLNSFKTSQPVSITANEGEPLKLQCQPPDGWPKPIVHWIYLYTDGGFKTINSSRMTLDPEGNLWFSNVTKEDATDKFMYACAATSPTKYEYKYGNRVLLNIVSTGVSASQNKVEPLEQYTTRTKEVAYLGKRAEMFCIFGGTPLPQIVWSKDGNKITPSDRVTQGNYGKSLIIKMVSFEDAGKYTCEASNGVGQPKTHSISLSVLAVPYFTKEPEKVTAAEDETIQFECEASGVPEPEIHWIHNGEPIEKAQPNDRRIVQKNKIIITNLRKSDTGNYGCNATNSLGYVYKDVYVNVLALAPEIVEPPRNMEAVDGQNVNMTCEVIGAPKPSIKWIHNGNERTGGRYTVQANGNLIISGLQFEDSGRYTCFAENKLGNASASAQLTVRSHTAITDGPENYEVEAGTPATFRCNAVADEALDLEIIWLKNGQPIDFEDEPRFFKSSDYSLTISKTIELDSGTYTCLAKTALDSASEDAQLIVQDVPNAPKLTSILCHSKDATISWSPIGDNRTPILRFIIQYQTNFTPTVWENAYDNVPSADLSYNVPMSPWAQYRFRLIAVNKIGESLPSSESDTCTTDPEVPHKNPDNVVGEGTRPDNLVISWTKMPEIEHNAPKFQYRVFWKRNDEVSSYQSVDIHNWTIDSYEVGNQPVFKDYLIKVIAMNELGEADVAPKEVIGFSGESEPSVAPSNFSLLQVQSATTALLSWNPVPAESINGHFKGYKIQTWSDTSTNRNEIQVQGDATKALVTNFVPFTNNYAVVYAYNSKYNGPPSDILSFVTPEGVPGQMNYLEAYPLGSSAFLLMWDKPERPNGILTGYNIYFAKVEDASMKVDPPTQKPKEIQDPNRLHAKLAGLEPGTNYRIYITARTSQGESKPYFIERQTRSVGMIKPSKPNFDWDLIKEPYNKDRPETKNNAVVQIHWQPNEDGRPGEEFFVQYKKKGEPEFLSSPIEKEDDVTNITLEAGEIYEVKVTSKDGDYHTDSDVKEVSTINDGGITVTHKDDLPSSDWFIGMMLAIAFLLLLLIIVCIVKRNRGGKYAVHEREQTNGRHDYPDEGGFHEYSQPLDNKSHGRTSMSSDAKIGPESDTDSMAEYGDGDTGRFTEDGSFIGQYVPSNMKQLGSSTTPGVNNNTMATYV